MRADEWGGESRGEEERGVEVRIELLLTCKGVWESVLHKLPCAVCNLYR